MRLQSYHSDNDIVHSDDFSGDDDMVSSAQNKTTNLIAPTDSIINLQTQQASNKFQIISQLPGVNNVVLASQNHDQTQVQPLEESSKSVDIPPKVKRVVPKQSLTHKADIQTMNNANNNNSLNTYKSMPLHFQSFYTKKANPQDNSESKFPQSEAGVNLLTNPQIDSHYALYESQFLQSQSFIPAQDLIKQEHTQPRYQLQLSPTQKQKQKQPKIVNHSSNFVKTDNNLKIDKQVESIDVGKKKEQAISDNQVKGVQKQDNLKMEQTGQVADIDQISFNSSDWEEVQSTTMVVDSSDYVDYAAIYYNSLQNKANKQVQQQQLNQQKLDSVANGANEVEVDQLFEHDASIDKDSANEDQSHYSSMSGALTNNVGQAMVNYQSGPVIRTDDISTIELGQSLVDQIFSKKIAESIQDNDGFDQSVPDRIHIGNFNADQCKPSKKITWQKGQLVPVGGTSLVLELAIDAEKTELSLLNSNQTQISLQSKVCKAATKVKKVENFLRKIPTRTLQAQNSSLDNATSQLMKQQSFFSYANGGALKSEGMISGSVLEQKRDIKGQKKKRRKLSKWKKRKNMIVEKVVPPAKENIINHQKDINNNQIANNNFSSEMVNTYVENVTQNDSYSYVQTATNTTVATNVGTTIEHLQKELNHNMMNNMQVLRENSHSQLKKDDQIDEHKLCGVDGEISSVLANSDQP